MTYGSHHFVGSCHITQIINILFWNKAPLFQHSCWTNLLVQTDMGCRTAWTDIRQGLGVSIQKWHGKDKLPTLWAACPIKWSVIFLQVLRQGTILQGKLWGNRNTIQTELIHIRSAVTKALSSCALELREVSKARAAHWREDRQMEIWEAVNGLPQSITPTSTLQTASVTLIKRGAHEIVCVQRERETWPAWVAVCCLPEGGRLCRLISDHF